jgi:capsule polysaccharide modification protein KpsS
MSLPDLGVSHALLLQGPAGPFMHRFGEELAQHGIRVTKVNFHGGDRYFFPDDTPFAEVRSFTEPMDQWPAYAAELFAGSIDGVFVFGGMRDHHQAAIRAAEAAGAKVWVFEEGYVRPDWITLEAHGVNGNSRMPNNPAFFLANAPSDEPPATPVGSSFGLSAWYSTLNALAFTHLNADFPHYEHHRPLNAWLHTAWWVRGAGRKYWFRAKERNELRRFTGPLSDRYFFVPLQVHCDFQLRHSPYGDVVEFIDEVLEDFTEHADPSHHLLFKHHPMDRPFREYTKLFAERAQRSGLGDRLHYVHDLHLPTLLKHARGTITINSTVGLQSAYHGTPVITLGTAVYDMPGLTHQGTLREFLAEPGEVDQELHDAFRRWLLHHNQVNGNFYKPLDDVDSPTGFRWFPGSPPAPS